MTGFDTSGTTQIEPLGWPATGGPASPSDLTEYFGPSDHYLDGSPHRAGQEGVVRVHDGDDLPPDHCEGLVDGPRLPHVRMALVSKVVVKLPHNGQGTIGRSIVEDKVFEIGVVLPDDAHDGLLDERLPVIGRGDDGDKGQTSGITHCLRALRIYVTPWLSVLFLWSISRLNPLEQRTETGTDFVTSREPTSRMARTALLTKSTGINLS